MVTSELTQGQALKILRMDIIGLKQDTYAKLVKVSRKTISEVENDRVNYTADVINKVFKPFGLKVGLVPQSIHLLASIIIPVFNANSTGETSELIETNK